MPQATDEAGNLWETDAQGNAVRLIQQAGAPSGNVVAPNPVRVAEKQREADRQAAADARSAGSDARAQAAADRAEREWNATHNPDGTPKKSGSQGGKPLPDTVAKRYEQAIDAFADYDRAVAGFQDNFAGNTLTGELENWAQNKIGTGTPGQAQWWSDFATTDNMIRNALFGASLTAGEKAAYEKTSVNPSMDPAQIRANLERRMTLAKEKLGRRTAFLKANGYDPEAVDALAGEYGDVIREQTQPRAEKETDKVAAVAGVSPPNDGSPPGLPPANSPGGQDTSPLSVAGGSTRTVDNPRANAIINGLMNAGASKGMIDAALKEAGFPTINYQDYNAAKQWMKKNPGTRYNGAAARDIVQQSMLERAAGSTTGAVAANMADAATAGISTALAGDRGRGALDAMKASSPNAAAAGSIIGGITGAGAAELAAGRMLGAGAARFAPRVGDALYGGTAGTTGAKDGEGLQGAAIGAGAGVLGGVIGERAMRGAGAMFRGITNPEVQALRQAGVPMTIGQAVGSSGRVGQFVKNAEDSMTSLPVVGGMVNARRMEGLQGFNRAAFDIAADQTGNQITDTGSAGIGQLRQAVGDAYSRALDPVTIDTNADPQMLADLVQARMAAQAIPNVQPTMPAEFAEGALENRIQGNIDPNGLMSGRNFQEGYRGLGRDARSRANADYGHEIGQVTRQGQDVLAGALERQNPGAFDQFRAANGANRRTMVLADAVNRAKSSFDDNGSEIFTPAQLNLADAGSTRRLNGPLASAAGDRPFYGLTQAGQSVLPSQVPDSGTAGRMMTGVALSGVAGAGGAGGYALGGGDGAATGTGAGLGAAIALALGGSRGAQNVATRMLLDRPDVAITIGEELRRRAALGGVGGAGILAQIVGGQ